LSAPVVRWLYLNRRSYFGRARPDLWPCYCVHPRDVLERTAAFSGVAIAYASVGRSPIGCKAKAANTIKITDKTRDDRETFVNLLLSLISVFILLIFPFRLDLIWIYEPFIWFQPADSIM
jgi:hypothetical protein